MSLPDGEYYIFDKFNEFVSGTSNGPPVTATFVGTSDQQWQVVSGEGVAQFLRNIRYETYIGFSDHNTVLTTSPLPWYINETTDTDWYQISRNSNQGGPFWVTSGEVSESHNGSLILDDGGWYSWFFLPVSQTSDRSAATTMLSSLIANGPSGSGPASPTESSSGSDSSSTIPIPASTSSESLTSNIPNPSTTSDSRIGGFIGTVSATSGRDTDSTTPFSISSSSFSSSSSPTSQNPPSVSSSQSSTSSRHVGAIVGGVVGGILLLLFAILAAWFLVRRSQARLVQRQAVQALQSPTAFTLREPAATSTLSDKASMTKSALRSQSPPPYEESMS
ncbi:hypothetical protein VKT23_014171 [Stygiomarasmius scandens]|uniref:Uncharacterized protein n=1 Tax=Marasmiellus scandens TaxID=2682957 RepID=A0ABR1J658_9AGAR